MSMKIRWRNLRRFATAAAVLVLSAAGLSAIGAVASTSANAAPGCSVAYTVPSQWNTGFTANIVITNVGDPITSWTLTYSYSGNQSLANGWNGAWTQSGENVTVGSLSYNGSLATGASTSLGANFNYSGTNTAPTSFSLNGVQCTGQTQGGGGSIQVSSSTLSVAQGATATVGVSLSAAPSANETVSVASSGNAGLTASPTSLTFTPSNFSTAQNLTITANSSGTGTTTFTLSGTGFTSATITANETTGVNNGTPTIVVSPTSQGVNQNGTGTVGISLSSAPSGSVTVTTSRTSGNTGLSVSSGGSLTFTSSNFSTAQNVTITADGTSTGQATFTSSATGLTSVTFTATENTVCTGTQCHVPDPFTGAKPFLDPEYTTQVNAQVSADGGNAAEAAVAKNPTAYWLDTICAIAGGSPCNRLGLQTELTDAAAQGTAATPSVINIVVYDLPGRDCAALASNGEIPGTSAGLTQYETQYIDPIASILAANNSPNLRVVAIIEPDSLPNVVTNQSKSACATATPFYEQGITYALNKLHAVSNVYNYLDIAHSAWLGWPNNMTGTPAVYNTVVKATTAGYASIDGFISDTANYTPVQEPFLTNPTMQVGGNPLDSVTFYQFNPTFDELTYDTQMYNTLVSAGFPTSKRFLIDTSRDGWGGSARPTSLNSTPTTAAAYVDANRIDKRPFRGDWCNINNSGIGARPADEPFGMSSPVMAFVWIKPPGYSDGDYPTSSHTHGDPHCDPNGTQTDGNGGTYPTDAIPGFDINAGLWFPAEFQMLVKNAFPTLP